MVFPNRSSNRGGRRRGVGGCRTGSSGAVAFLRSHRRHRFLSPILRLHNYHQRRPESRTLGQRPAGPTQSPYATVQDAALADANANLGSLIVNNLNPALTAANVTSSPGPTDRESDGERYSRISV